MNIRRLNDDEVRELRHNHGLSQKGVFKDGYEETSDSDLQSQALTKSTEYLPLHKHVNILEAISPLNPNIRASLSDLVEKLGPMALLKAENELIISVYIQARMENKDLTIEDAFISALSMVLTMDKDKLYETLEQDVLNFVTDSYKEIRRRFPDINEEFQRQVAKDVSGAVMRLQIFIDTYASEKLDLPKEVEELHTENLRQSLLVYPVMYHLVEELKDIVDSVKDEL